MEEKSVAIAVARCTHSRSHFGVRIELKAISTWVADWAFALKESSARKEGYDRTRIEGRFCIGDAYPGCPFCSARSLVQCECGRVSCLADNSTVSRCPWCGHEGHAGGQASSLGVGSDR
jgi:hypothetical protein